VRSPIEAVLPFWLDRPDLEAVEIAEAVHAAGIGGLWVGEMATFDAFALATAIGIRAPGVGLRIGPLPISVRTPASIALGASSVAATTGAQVDIALGASSPFIVSGWHDRDWSHSAARMREAIECLRSILRGERSDYDGRFVRCNGFRLRNPLPHSRIGVGAFGPSMMKLSAQFADEVVLNLASPQRVSQVREQIEQDAAAVGRVPPHISRRGFRLRCNPVRPRCASWPGKSRCTSPHPDTVRCSANSGSPISSNGPARVHGGRTWPQRFRSNWPSNWPHWAHGIRSLTGSGATWMPALTPSR
jgi:alkanesulfonate monooxygenase SsuD/methylene tetrahydromethanopterin reductase-like flavin-dependent oxidoreductase (luciferase family)